MDIRKFVKIGLSSLVAILTIYILIVLFFVHAFFKDGGLVSCSETMITESPSPQGKYVASVFSGSCGATTPFVTSVNIRQRSDNYFPNKNGILTSGRVFSAKGQLQIRLLWQNDLKLIIEHSSSDHITEKTTWNDVTIVYSPLNSLN